MRAAEPCPHCGAGRGDEALQPLTALYAEVARIRELAERQQRDQETIARLSHEVQMLRETLARLRGTSYRGVPRPQEVRTTAGSSAA